VADRRDWCLIYSKQAPKAFQSLEGHLSPEVLTQFTTLFADCRLPLEHRGTVDIQAAPFQGQTLDINQIISSSDNPTYSTLSVTNPYSQFIFDDDQNITHVDGGFTGWFNGVTWWQYAMAYWAYFDNSTIKNLTVNNIIKDGYQFEDRRVLADVTVTFSFDSATCEGTVTVNKTFVNIKTLVREDDAGDNSPVSNDPSDDDGGASSPTGPDGQPYPGMTVPTPTDPPIYLNNPSDPAMGDIQDVSANYPVMDNRPRDYRTGDIIPPDIWKQMNADDQEQGD
jgi:hypothetical protein